MYERKHIDVRRRPPTSQEYTRWLCQPGHLAAYLATVTLFTCAACTILQPRWALVPAVAILATAPARLALYPWCLADRRYRH